MVWRPNIMLINRHWFLLFHVYFFNASPFIFFLCFSCYWLAGVIYIFKLLKCCHICYSFFLVCNCLLFWFIILNSLAWVEIFLNDVNITNAFPLCICIDVLLWAAFSIQDFIFYIYIYIIYIKHWFYFWGKPWLIHPLWPIHLQSFLNSPLRPYLSRNFP